MAPSSRPLRTFYTSPTVNCVLGVFVAGSFVLIVFLARCYRKRSPQQPLNTARCKPDIEEKQPYPEASARYDVSEMEKRFVLSDPKFHVAPQEPEQQLLSHENRQVQFPSNPLGLESRPTQSFPQPIQTYQFSDELCNPKLSDAPSNSHLSNKTGFHTDFPYPVPTDAGIQLWSSHIPRDYPTNLGDANAESWATGEKDIPTPSSLQKPGLQSETMQVFLGAELNRPRRWRRRVLEYG